MRFTYSAAIFAAAAMITAGQSSRTVPGAVEPHQPAARTRMDAVVQQWMRSMSLRDKAAQLVFMPCFGENPSTRSKEYQRFRRWVRDLRIGGLIVVNRVVGGTVRHADPYAMALFLNRMQRLASVPLLVSADFERGASMRVADTIKFPHNMAYGAARDYEGSTFEGAHTAREARALGVHWVFAPDADVNNNPDNPIINIRSYGEDPQDVARHVNSYIRGIHSDPANRVLATVKHFPGHGDTAVDTHLGLAKLDVDRSRLDAVEWVPFRAAIDSGVDAVMTAHIALPAVEPDEIPSTISERVLTNVLRDDLGFNGLVVTDAMDMQGLTRQFPPGEASVRALEAGVDVLLMPTDADKAIRAVVDAVTSGRLSRKRLDRSISRVLAAKARLGLARRRIVNVDTIADAIENPEAEVRAQQTADRAVTLVRNEGAHVPLRDPGKSCLFVLLDGRYALEGQQLSSEIEKRAPQMKIRTLDSSASPAEVQDNIALAGGCNIAVVAAWITASAYRSSVALPGTLTGFVNSLTESETPVVFLSFGNPYLLRSFPKVASYLAMFSTVPMSELSSVKALFGEIPITGRLPVTIPGLAKIGDGIQVFR
jgi:beta-N-acetylhexosaminidase